MPQSALSLQMIAPPRVEYREYSPALAPGEDALTVIAFGRSVEVPREVGFLQVALEPLHRGKLVEIWRAKGPVSSGSQGAIRFRSDGEYLFGVMEIDEREYSGLNGAAQFAYSVLQRFLSASPCPNLLRVWNHFSAINDGRGDAERYKLFCAGRAAGLGTGHRPIYPAASVIGRHDADARLQIYWLSARCPGLPLENPRQVNPYHYPREYGPAAPQFSRAMLVAQQQLLVSGTASIVGHSSHHPDDLRAQLRETLLNINSVLQKAAGVTPALTPRLGADSVLKIYLRDPQRVALVEEMLHELLPDTPRVILAGDVCRSNLLIEAECVHGLPHG